MVNAEKFFNVKQKEEKKEEKKKEDKKEDKPAAPKKWKTSCK